VVINVSVVYGFTFSGDFISFLVLITTFFTLRVVLCASADSKVGGAVGAAATLLPRIFFSQKAAFFRVKGIYFVVRICDKRGRS